MVPVEPGAIANGECVVERVAGGDERLAVAVVGGIDGEAVPMQDGRLGERVAQLDSKHRPALRDERRVHVIAASDASGERKAGTRAALRRLDGKNVGIHAQEALQSVASGHVQRLVEA